MAKKRRGIAVIELATDEEIAFVDVRPGRDIDKVNRGMLINMDRDNYCTKQVDDFED